MPHLPDLLAGTLHIHVAFDWGEEIDLEAARRLLPAEARQLPRRRRTPASIGYRPDPLNFPLATPTETCEPLAPLTIGSAEATVFDLGAVSVALHAPFQASPQELLKLAGEPSVFGAA